MDTFLEVLKAKANTSDLEHFVSIFNTVPVPPLVKNVTMACLLREYKCNGCTDTKVELLEHIETDILYCGSHDVSTWLWGYSEPGVVIGRIESHLGQSRTTGTVSDRLKSVFQKNATAVFLSYSEEEKRKLLRASGFSESMQKELVNGVVSFGLMAIAHILGAHVKLAALGSGGAAKLIIGNFVLACVGCQVVIGAGAAYMAYYLQSPAYRMTTPSILRLGYMLAR